MAAEVPIDVVEQILLGLDVKDILRYKSVCKSWRSLISSPAFVKAHLKHQNNIIGGGHRMIENEELRFISDDASVVGSCNGLVCVSPKGVELQVTNPWTGEIKKLQKPRYRREDEVVDPIRHVLTLGFGYDASTDDYKVVAGFRTRVSEERTDFYVLALKSNVWKFVGEVKYRNSMKYHGVFYDGALYWFMMAARKKVIMSVDLSTDIFKEIPQPADAEFSVAYKRGSLFGHHLAVVEECLCIYSTMSAKKWVMKNNKWELYNCDESKYDVVHRLTEVGSRKKTCNVYTIDGGRIVSRTAKGHIISSSMLVQSLVSPHPSKVQREGNNDARQHKKEEEKEEDE